MIYCPRDQFLPFHVRSQRWAVLVSHRRSGKTVACVNELLTRALATTKEKAQYGYIAPYFVQSKLIAWEYLKSYGEQVIVKSHESELYVELVNGSKIYLFGADNPNRLRGLYLDGVVLDEFADMKPTIWGEIIRPLLADRKGWAVFIGTPKGHNAFYDIWQKAKVADDWFSFILKASTSGLLAADELKDARQTMSEDQYAQEFECSFEAAIIGSYYGKLMTKMEEEGRICNVPYNSASPVYTAWDLGSNNATSIVFFQIVGREPRIIDFYEDNDIKIDPYVKIVKEKPYIYAAHVLPHDAGHGSVRTGITLSTQMANLGLGVEGRDIIVLPRDGFDAGISLVSQLLPQLVINNSKECLYLVEALKNYQRKWDDERKTFAAQPLKDWSTDAADAVRYMATYMAMENPGIVRSRPDYQTFNHDPLAWMAN